LTRPNLADDDPRDEAVHAESLPANRPPLDVDELRRRTATHRVIGRSVTVLAETESTMDDARRLAESADGHGHAVFAEAQTKGRGQRGRTWLAPPGSSIHLSVALVSGASSAASDSGTVDRTLTAPTGEGGNELGRLIAWSAVAVCETLETVGLTPSIKWPNDILVDGRKIAGILIERTLRPTPILPESGDPSKASATAAVIVAGIGINVHQTEAEFPERPIHPATSVRLELARRGDAPKPERSASAAIDRTAIAATLLERLDHRWREVSAADPLERDRVPAGLGGGPAGWGRLPSLPLGSEPSNQRLRVAWRARLFVRPGAMVRVTLRGQSAETLGRLLELDYGAGLDLETESGIRRIGPEEIVRIEPG
jgi:biotin-(acetyl-CoA carboxylase) ligase